jgi:poly(3-hydroxybutyrate) depolymerase
MILVGLGACACSASRASPLEVRPDDAATGDAATLAEGGESDDAAADATVAPRDGSPPSLSDALTPTGAVCTTDDGGIVCSSQSMSLSDGTNQRLVTYAVPIGTPPSGGWPAVIYFQGSLVPGHTAFAATETDPFGMYDLTLTIAALLARGYVVVAPDTPSGGTTFWQTNIPPYSATWSGCADDVLMHALLASLAQGTLGPVNASRLYAMGISSGGFMTSRMAVSYAGTFRALVDHSGSYATCSDVCVVPTPLPTDHPPTLFLHGDTDIVVPTSAVQPYLSALQAEGFEASLVTDADAGHQWLSEAITAIPDWFDAHP